jgi:putative nucleotidyltransferase with HDIG domain
MSTFVVTPKYQPFELPIEAKGRQYIGYLDLSSLEQSPCGQFASFCLIDANNQILRFTINQKIWRQIQQQIKAIHFDSKQQLYIWIEMNSDGIVVNSRVFQAGWQIEQLITVFQSCYHFEALYQLLKVVQGLATPAIAKFGHELLTDIKLMSRWVSLPASKRHHHSYPGGLLAHSLECAFITEQNVAMLTELSIREKEVTVLAALLHDIGKTQTLSMDGHTSTGRLIDHELLTLQVLAQPLEILSKGWSDGAQVLQYLLTWKSSMGFCKFIGGNIIKLADQISTSASLRRMAFKDKPNYFHFAELQVGSRPQYLNRLH